MEIFVDSTKHFSGCAAWSNSKQSFMNLCDLIFFKYFDHTFLYHKDRNFVKKTSDDNQNARKQLNASDIGNPIQIILYSLLIEESENIDVVI